MKTVFCSSLSLLAITLLTSCTNNTSKENGAWAGTVESKTMIIKPEGFQEEYWMEINKNVNYDNIFKTITEAVFKGKKQAYDIITEKPLTIDEVKTIMGLNGDGSEQVTARDLSAIRMRESWDFNEKDFSVNKKVKRIDLLLKKIDPTTGEYLGDRALFYIKLDE